MKRAFLEDNGSILTGIFAFVALIAWLSVTAPPVNAQAPRQHMAASTPVSLVPGVASTSIVLVPGAGTTHVEAQDQDGNRLAPALFTWAVPAGANIGVQEDGTGWFLSAPLGAPAGSFVIAVQYNPNHALSPSVTVSIGKSITNINIVVSPK